VHYCALLHTELPTSGTWYTAAYYTARFRIFIVYMWCNATCASQDTAIFSSCEAFEFMDSVSMEIVEKHLRHRNPISAHPFYVLVETSGSHAPHDTEVGRHVRWACEGLRCCSLPVQKLNAFLESVMSAGLIEDGTVAADMSKVCCSPVIIDTVTSAIQSEAHILHLCRKYEPLDH